MAGVFRGAEAGASAPNGFVSVYFSVPASEAVAPGATAEVYLLGEVADKGIAIPRSALSEQQGSYFVYEKSATTLTAVCP